MPKSSLASKQFVSVLLLVMLGLAGSVNAREWTLPLEGPLCRDHVRVAPDGKAIVYLERTAEQPPPQKGPPVPANAVIWYYDLETKKPRQRLGKRDTAKNVYPVFFEPAAGGRWLATLVNKKSSALGSATAPATLLYIVDRQKTTSSQIARDMEHFFWSPADGTLVVSFQRDDEGTTRPIRRYDPKSGKWTDSKIHGTCWAESSDGRVGLYTVALDSVNRSTTNMLGEGKTHLAVIDRSGRVVRAFSHVADLVDTPRLSPNGKFVASAQFRLGQPSGADRFVAILSVETGAALSVPGHRDVLAVTNEGAAIVLDFDGDVNGGRQLAKLARDGRLKPIVKNATVAAASDKRIFYVASDAPRVLRSEELSGGPVDLFASDGKTTDDKYLDSISADRYLDSLEDSKRERKPNDAPVGVGDLRDFADPSEPVDPPVVSSGGTSPGTYKLSPQQRTLQKRLGYPQLFTIRFIEEKVGQKQISCRSEKWVYTAARTEFEFLDGECIGTKKLEARKQSRTVIANNPTQFVMGSSEKQIREKLGLSDLKPFRLKEAGMKDPLLKQVSLWTNGTLLLGFANDRLVQVQCLSRPLPKP